MKKQPLYWIGIRESELEDTSSLFEGSITIFGSGKGNNYAFDKEFAIRYDYNEDSDLLNEFINLKAKIILTQDPNARFMLYYPVDIAILDREVASKTLYVNDIQITDFLDDKIKTRNWLIEHIPMPHYCVTFGEKINYEYLISIFPDYNKFVVQSDYSCGGSGTWLLTKDNISDIMKRISFHEKYTLLPYYEHSVSVNIHLIIYEQEILLMPASVQIITQKSYSLAYHGSDFIMYQYLPKHLQDKVNRYAEIIGKQLQYSGYRGVCGIDFIVTQDEVYFSEINGRFQSSTVLINKAMQSSGLNLSLQQLHIDAFLNSKCTVELPMFNVNYSLFGFSYNPETFVKTKYLFELTKNCPQIACCQDDALDWNMKLENNTYLFKIICDTNLAAVGAEFETILHPNFNLDTHILHPENYLKELPELKIMLLSHGISIGEQALEKLNAAGGVNFEEFEAIDLKIEKNIYINVPYQTKFSLLSPFHVELAQDGELYLKYFYTTLTTCQIRTKNILDSHVTKNGFSYDDFMYLGNDRLRINHRVGCNFKSIGKGCKFCDIEECDMFLPMEDIKEAVEAYAGYECIQHFLIGGGSEPVDSDFQKIIEIAKYLKERFHKPINVMSLPPLDTDVLYNFKDVGITEVTFNLEVYDRLLAPEYMPGKGALSLDIYDKAFQKSVQIWGRTGNVRTVFIVGLECEKTLLEGIRHVCAMGVSPILSLLKGVNGTPMAHVLPPSDEQILKIYNKVQNICRTYGIEQGPSCRCCEDNTLKISC